LYFVIERTNHTSPRTHSIDYAEVEGIFYWFLLVLIDEILFINNDLSSLVYVSGFLSGFGSVGGIAFGPYRCPTITRHCSQPESGISKDCGTSSIGRQYQRRP